MTTSSIGIVRGVDFLALQVRDLERSAAFYEGLLGLTRAPSGPPNAVVFASHPLPFAVRLADPDFDWDTVVQAGIGVVPWLRCDDTDALYLRLCAANIPIIAEPANGPFGRQFTFADPDGYRLIAHDQG